QLSAIRGRAAAAARAPRHHARPGAVRRTAQSLGPEGAGGDSAQARLHFSVLRLVGGKARRAVPPAATPSFQSPGRAALGRRARRARGRGRRDLPLHLGRRSRRKRSGRMGGARAPAGRCRRRRARRARRRQAPSARQYRARGRGRRLWRADARGRRQDLLGRRRDGHGARLSRRSGPLRARRDQPRRAPATRCPASRPMTQWLVELIVPDHAVPVFQNALEPFASAVTAFEMPGEKALWRLAAYAEGPPEERALDAALTVAALGTGVAKPAVQIGPLPDADWLAESRRALPPVVAGRWYIHGSHVTAPPPAGKTALRIDAGLAFGAGSHETTRGCLIALDRLARRRRFRRP